MNIEAALEDGIDLQTALYRTLAENEEAVKGLKSAGYTLAEARKDSRLALAKAMLNLRQTGLPASMVKDVARGESKVADAMFNEDLHEALWEAQREEVMLRKREADVLREEIARMHAEEGRRSW